MVSLFDQIRLDILKHKELGLTEDEIAELPPLNIEIDEREFLGWLFNGQRANIKILARCITNIVGHNLNKGASNNNAGLK